MNKIFIDTEFTDFIQIDLISLGAVTEDGEHEFYIELHDYNKEWTSEWVKQNVVPYLHTEGFGKFEAGLKFYKWLKGLPRQADGYVFCIDYEADWHLALDLLDGQDPLNVQEEPAYVNVALYTEAVIESYRRNVDAVDLFDRSRKVFINSSLDYFFVNKLIQHHALNDAKANRYAWLESLNYMRTK